MRVHPLLSGRLWRIATWAVVLLLIFAVLYTLVILAASLTNGINV